MTSGYSTEDRKSSKTKQSRWFTILYIWQQLSISRLCPRVCQPSSRLQSLYDFVHWKVFLSHFAAHTHLVTVYLYPIRSTYPSCYSIFVPNGQYIPILLQYICAQREVWQVPKRGFWRYCNCTDDTVTDDTVTVLEFRNERNERSEGDIHARYSSHFRLTGKQRPLPQLRPYLQLENPIRLLHTLTLQRTPESKKCERECSQVNLNDSVKRFNVCCTA